tara:strand:+ start:155 stop:385 length:231 start_codon:yes stop_codon:yes gene_type:complete
MALTFRSTKGSALTIAEMDSNFAHFTGSHSVTGSFEVTGSVVLTIPSEEPTIPGSLWLSGSSAAHPSSSFLMVYNP